MQTAAFSKTFPSALFFFSTLVLFVSMGAAASACPSGTSYSVNCQVIGGVACGTVGPDCAGVPSKMSGGKMAAYDCQWTGDGYDNCVCACPYVDKCAGKPACPETKCDGDIASHTPKCNSDTGECVYGQSVICPGGCNRETGECSTCQKDADCPNECAGGEAKPGKCTNGKCGLGAPQACKCGCAAEQGVCMPDSACQTVGTESDKCLGKTCQSKCEKPSTYGFSALKTSGVCDPETGECAYQSMDCPNGCSENENGVFCLEECDNGIDDDGNGKIDCEDTAVCADSLYCKCSMVQSKSGDGRKLQVLVGGYDYNPQGPEYRSQERDAEAMKDAADVFNTLSSTYPFSKYGLEVWVTRLPNGVLGPWRSDLLAKCPEAKADVTVFVSTKTSRTSNSRFYSMNADLYKRTINDLPWTLVHELGHGVGGLWDEYSIRKEIGVMASGASAVRDTVVEKPMTNCCWLPEEECGSFYSGAGIANQLSLACSMGNWYKTSENSVMNAETVGQGRDYNSAGGYFVDKRLRNLLIGPDPEVSRETAMPGYAPGQNYDR